MVRRAWRSPLWRLATVLRSGGVGTVFRWGADGSSVGGGWRLGVPRGAGGVRLGVPCGACGVVGRVGWGVVCFLDGAACLEISSVALGDGLAIGWSWDGLQMGSGWEFSGRRVEVGSAEGGGRGEVGCAVWGVRGGGACRVGCGVLS